MLLGTLLFCVFHSHQSNVSATMQQPSSVVHNKLQNTQPLNTHRKEQVFSPAERMVCCVYSTMCLLSAYQFSSCVVHIMCIDMTVA